MVGHTNREQAEAIYREGLRTLTEAELASELKSCEFLLRTTLNGPYTEDLWKREYLREEVERRKLQEPGRRTG